MENKTRPACSVLKEIPPRMFNTLCTEDLRFYWQRPTSKASKIKEPCACCGRIVTLMASCLCPRCYMAVKNKKGRDLIITIVDLNEKYYPIEQEKPGAPAPEPAAASPSVDQGPEKNGSMENAIGRTCDEIKEFLLKKNRSYGNSAAKPVRIFSKASALEQINVRIDDKLSRLMHGKEYPGDDTELDLVGYLILKRAIKSCGVGK